MWPLAVGAGPAQLLHCATLCVWGMYTADPGSPPPPPPEYGGLGLVAGMRLLTVVSCHGLCVRTPVLSTTPPFF